MIHHEGAINSACNSNVLDPQHGFIVSSQCLNIVWPYSEGFILVIGGAIFVFAALMLTRRVMSGERQYMKDLKAGKYSRENDHLNAYHFNIQIPNVKIGAGARVNARDIPPDG
jgi:hypothetical protein